MMRSVLVVLAAVAATTISAAPVAAKELQKPQAISAATAKLRLATAMTEARGSKVYIVRMAAQPAASYKGGLSGFARTAAVRGERYNAHSGQSEAYTRMLQSEQDALLASIGASSERKIYSYVHTMNGFAARLSAVEAAKLRKDKRVLNVWEDKLLRPDTNNSPRFLGITNPNNGLRGALGLTGENVIIGIDRHRHRSGTPQLRRHGLRPAAPSLVRHLPDRPALVERRLHRQADWRPLVRATALRGWQRPGRRRVSSRRAIPTATARTPRPPPAATASRRA